VRRFLEKSIVIADINLTFCLDCFGVQFLLCKIMHAKGVFAKNLEVDMSKSVDYGIDFQ
jgi:hypothetical protein